eukprot:2850505-Amphidinium_carterae.2
MSGAPPTDAKKSGQRNVDSSSEVLHVAMLDAFNADNCSAVCQPTHESQQRLFSHGWSKSRLTAATTLACSLCVIVIAPSCSVAVSVVVVAAPQPALYFPVVAFREEDPSISTNCRAFVEAHVNAQKRAPN